MVYSLIIRSHPDFACTKISFLLSGFYFCCRIPRKRYGQVPPTHLASVEPKPVASPAQCVPDSQLLERNSEKGSFARFIQYSIPYLALSDTSYTTLEKLWVCRGGQHLWAKKAVCQCSPVCLSSEMVKFSKELNSNITPEWRKQYIPYERWWC